MFTNRITDFFPPGSPSTPEGTVTQSPQTYNVVPFASLNELYQAAALRARRDYELDKLFNPDYYGDYGSGI